MNELGVCPRLERMRKACRAGNYWEERREVRVVDFTRTSGNATEKDREAGSDSGNPLKLRPDVTTWRSSGRSFIHDVAFVGCRIGDAPDHIPVRRELIRGDDNHILGKTESTQLHLDLDGLMPARARHRHYDE